MNKIICIAIMFVGLAAGSARAETYYESAKSTVLSVKTMVNNGSSEVIFVSQAGSGTNSGLNAANSRSVTWFNTASNWSASAGADGKIGPGDTVNLCGTFTSQAVINGSGSSGNPITIRFENNAKFSKAHWHESADPVNITSADGAIYANSQSNIVIDGGVNGIIECTDNGLGKTFGDYSLGIYVVGTYSSWEVKNLAIRNICSRYKSASLLDAGNCLRFDGDATNVQIHHNNVYGATVLIYVPAKVNGLEVYSNSGGHASVVLIVGSRNINNVNIHHNDFQMFDDFDGIGQIHNDLVQIFADNARADGVSVYGNLFTLVDDVDHITALLYLTENIYSPRIYNNVFVQKGMPGGGNGMLFLNGVKDAMVMNNTFIAKGVWTAITAGNGNLNETGMIIKNNLFYDVAIPIEEAPSINTPGSQTSVISECDYNVYFCQNGAYPQFGHGVGFRFASFDQWKAHLQNVHGLTVDAHSSLAKPTLDANYVPTSSDMVIRNKGVAMSSYFTTDILGTARPQGSGWDIGAYEFVTSGPVLTLTSPNGAEVWRRGETRAITWTANGITGNLVIELLQNGSVVGLIASGVSASQGTYTWTVGTYQGGTISAGSGYKIRISSAAGTVLAEKEIH